MARESSEPTGSRPPFRLGEWVVEPELNRVSRGERSAQLPPKAMEVLVALADRPGEVILRRQLIDTVWRVEFVSDNVLAQAVADLRQALSDDAGAPQFIETIARRGYRLVAPVEPVRPAAQPGRPSGTAVRIGEQEIVLRFGDNLIGRSPEADVRVDSDQVSRRHAMLVVSPDAVTLEDLGSKNGTYLWGAQIERPTILEEGDEITVGPALLVVASTTGLSTTRTARHDDPTPGT